MMVKSEQSHTLKNKTKKIPFRNLLLNFRFLLKSLTTKNDTAFRTAIYLNLQTFQFKPFTAIWTWGKS